MTPFPDIREVLISNMIYYVGHLAPEPGEAPWDTGPCESPTIASQRLELYRRGEPVSEAPPQQFSRRQMEALNVWLSCQSINRAPINPETVATALDNGPLTEDWVWVSVLGSSRSKQLPGDVLNAGGTRVRRGPKGPVVIDAVGQVSLYRSM